MDDDQDGEEPDNFCMLERHYEPNTVRTQVVFIGNFNPYGSEGPGAQHSRQRRQHEKEDERATAALLDALKKLIPTSDMAKADDLMKQLLGTTRQHEAGR